MRTIILFILLLMGCSKPEEPEPCKCAEFTDSGWGIPAIHYIGYWQELTFCSGKVSIWLCPDSTWILDPTHCWQELPEIEIPSKTLLTTLHPTLNLIEFGTFTSAGLVGFLKTPITSSNVLFPILDKVD